MGPEPVVVGYFPDWMASVASSVDYGRVTDVVAFSLETTPEGELDEKWLTEGSLGKLKELKKQHGFRLLMAVGGWERSEGFPAMAASERSRAAFVRNVAEYIRTHGLDGIDLDWEHPKNAQEESDYATLMVELKAELGPKGKLVTAALAGWQNLPPQGIEALDRLHLMSYDHPERHSTLDLARSDVQKWLDRGMDRAQIALGVPFYGRKIEAWNEAASYAEIVERFSPKPEDDEAGGFYYNGPETMREKAAWARSEGLAGIMIWELSQDASGDRALLRAIGRGLGRE